MTVGIYVLLIAGPRYLWQMFKGRAEGCSDDIADTCLSKCMQLPHLYQLLLVYHLYS